MARRAAKTSSRRSYSGNGKRKSGPSGRSYGASASRAPRRPRSGGRASGRQQTVRVVIEHAGAAPVRAGDAVSISQKVAAKPRVKPRM